MNPVSLPKRFLLLLLLSIALALFTVAACGGGEDEEENPFGLKSEVVTSASNGGGIAFAPDGRLFYGEHWTGAIRVVSTDGQLLPDPFATLSDVSASAVWGLTGLALDPDFADNHYVYALYTQLVAAGPPIVVKPTVVRFTDSDNKGTEQQLLVSDLPQMDPAHPYNASGSLHAGPDGNLYLTLGDYDQAQATGPTGLPLAQDLGTPIGKMLRISKENGSAPPDNPFVNDPGADPRVFASGFRVPFNFVFHAESGRIYGSDNSGSICEEVNIVDKGLNYGHSQTSETPYSNCQSLPGAAAIYFTAQEGYTPEQNFSTVGITGMEFISASIYPTLGDSLVFCEGGTKLMRRLVLAPPNFDQVTADDVIARDCGLDVTVGPDGLIYYANGTEIRRLIQAPEPPLVNLPSPPDLSGLVNPTVWWLAVELIGLAAFPIAFAALRFLPDRGYSVTKLIGLLLMTYLLWLGGTVHLIPNRRLSIFGILALMTVVSAILAWRNRSEIASFIGKRWAHLAFADVLFTAVFVLCLFLRSLATESLTLGNDNAFTVAFVNSILRSEYFPPEDPWLSGHSISYYYFGFVIVAALTKLTGIASGVTFNLTIALVPALAASAAFGIVYNLLIERGKQLWVLASGVLAGIFLIFLSNIEALFELLAIHGVGSQGFYETIDVAGLGVTRESPEWFPTDSWTYRSVNFSGRTVDSVFPFFDLLLPIGYLSGRNTAIPMFLLVITTMVNVLRSDSSRFRSVTPADAVAVGFMSLALGALIATHAWDFPTSCVLILATFTFRNYWLERRFNLAVLRRTALFGAAIGALAGLLYLPYFLNASGQFNGMLIVPPEVAKEPHHVLYMWLPLFWLATCLALFALRGFQLNDRRLWAAVVLPVLVLASWAAYRIVDGSFSRLQDDIEVRGSAWISVAILMALVALLALALLKQLLTVPAERREPPLVFALLLAAIAVLLILGIEFFYVNEVTTLLFLNSTTILRVNFQGWLLLSLAGAIGIYYVGATWSPAQATARLARVTWASVTLALVSAGLLFPVMASFYFEDRVADQGGGRHLDGLAYLKRIHPNEQKAIQYLSDSVKGRPVILEGVTDSYCCGGGRISAFTGLPTVLGWVTHEFYFRGSHEPWFHRRDDVALAYQTPDPKVAAAILAKYDVEYVVVGGLETGLYGTLDPETGLYETLDPSTFSSFMDIAFQEGEITIYKTRTDVAEIDEPPNLLPP